MAPNEVVRRELVNAIVGWLDTERAAMAKSWADQGVPSTKMVERLLAYRTYERTAERTAKWEMKFERTMVRKSEFRLGRGVPVFFRFSNEPPGDLFFAAYPQEHLDAVLWRDSAENVITRVARFFGFMCGDYLASVEVMEVANLERAEQIAQDYLRFLEADAVLEVSQVILGGFTPPATPLEIPDLGVSLRALSPEEMGELTQGFGLMSLAENAALPSTMSVLRQHQLALEACMLTVKTSRSRTEVEKWDVDKPLSSSAADHLVLALQLIGRTPHGSGLAACWTEPGPRQVRIPKIVRLPLMPEGPETELTERDASRASQIAARIPSSCFDHPSNREDIALHRFSLAMAHDQDEDAIIDYVIALEALLTPGSQFEASFRLSLNGARFIADDRGERRQVFEELRDLYSLRSRLVHGVASGKCDTRAFRKKARALTARGLSKALLKGWPSREDFLTEALSH